MPGQSSAHQVVVGITLNALDTTIKTGSRKGQRNYDVTFKKRLAIAACEPGVSVARLALEHGINANMLHKWRRAHLAVIAGGGNEPRPTQFLAVSLAHPNSALAAPAMCAPSRQLAAPVPALPVRQPGSIEIRMGAATLRLEGAVDTATLEQVLRHLHP